MTNKKTVAVAMVLFAVSVGAHAQSSGIVRPSYEFPAPPAATGPASMQVGSSPFFFSPYVGVGAGYDDNLFLTNGNEKSSTLYVFNPGFTLDARDPNKVIQLRYQAQIGRYGQSEADDYVDQNGRAQFDMAITSSNFLRLGLDYVRGHDPRGSTDRPIGPAPDKYKQTNPFATYAFGAPGAQGRLEAYYSYQDRKYLNNRETTAGSDRKTEEYGGVFYWRVMPKTYAIVEARETRIAYHLPTSPLDANETRIYGGVSWEATAATVGTIKVGNLKRRPEADNVPEFSGTSWEATVTWSPRTYSKFDFFTARQTNESTGLGNFILSSIAGVSWNHAWSSVLSTGVDYRFQKDEYQGFDRTDKSNILGLKVGYKFRRWLTLGAEYSHTQRDSNLPTFEYDKNLYLLTATASM